MYGMHSTDASANGLMFAKHSAKQRISLTDTYNLIEMALTAAAPPPTLHNTSIGTAVDLAALNTATATIENMASATTENMASATTENMNSPTTSAAAQKTINGGSFVVASFILSLIPRFALSF